MEEKRSMEEKENKEIKRFDKGVMLKEEETLRWKMERREGERLRRERRVEGERREGKRWRRDKCGEGGSTWRKGR